MFRTVEEENDIELLDLEHTKHFQHSQQRHASYNTLSDADQLTKHDRSNRHSSQNGPVGPLSGDCDNSINLSRHNGKAAIPGILRPLLAQYHAPSDSASTPAYVGPGAFPTRRFDRTVHSLGIASNQPSRILDQPQFLSGEIVPHTGNGKGKADWNQPRRSFDRPLSGQIVPHTGKGKDRIPNVELKASIDTTWHPDNLPQRSRLPPLPVNNYRRDTQFERRQYSRKIFERLQLEGRYLCTAVLRDRCRAHGTLFRTPLARLQAGEDLGFSHRDRSPTRGFMNDIFDLDDAVSACGTIYDLSGLAEDGGVVAEKRRKDRNTVICLDGMMVLFMCLLGIAAIAISVVEQT